MAGYLLGKREHLNREYIEKNVVGIMSKLVSWVIFWISVHFIRTGELYDLWGNITAGAIAGGVLPVTWFLFTYCLLLIVGYPAWLLYKKYRYIFGGTAIIWVILLAFDMGRNMVGTRVQSLWLHLYIGYFILGMALPTIMDGILAKIKKEIFVMGASVLAVGSLIYYAWVVRNAETYLAPHNYYGKWFYSVWLISFFLICTMISFKEERVVRLLKTLADNTFVVYLGHLPILLYITSIRPLQTTHMAVLYVIFFFIGLELLAQLFRRMPLLRKLV